MDASTLFALNTTPAGLQAHDTTAISMTAKEVMVIEKAIQGEQITAADKELLNGVCVKWLEGWWRDEQIREYESDSRHD